MANIVASLGKTYALYRLLTGLLVAAILFSIGSSLMAKDGPLELKEENTGKVTKVNSKLVGSGSWVSASVVVLLGYLFYSWATSSNNAARLSALVGTADLTSSMLRRR
jgi:hypothetical protein